MPIMDLEKNYFGPLKILKSPLIFVSNIAGHPEVIHLKMKK